MDNLETIMQDKELVKNAVKLYLKNNYCPKDFNLPEESCINYADCEDCWTEALKQD